MHNRKLALKAGLPLWMASIALALIFPAGVCQAASSAVMWAVIAATPGQPSGSGSSARDASDKLLREARAAIKAGDYSRAESLINDAEKLGVKYNPLTDRWSDTPDVLRKLLATERAKANATKPGSRAPALLGGFGAAQAKPVPTDPTSSQAADSRQINTAIDKISGDQKSRAVAFLKDARAALTKGDKYAALGAWQKAAAIPANYAPNEDSPQRVADDLVAAGIDRTPFKPAPRGPASPFSFRPTHLYFTGDRPPPMGTPGTSPPPP